MEYFIRGKNKISLSQNDFIAKGGEGQIFGKGNTVYKIYIDKSKMIPEGKIRELSILVNDSIIIPQDIILDGNNPCGFSMKWIKNTIPICKLFTNGFRAKNNINNGIIIKLIDKIKKIIEFIHSKNCLVVDGNELNYLVNNRFNEIYLIDTDSLQTQSYPATAIMPSIKDYHSSTFTPLTDWFSFGILACQILIGMHPFKGKYQGYGTNELEKRMYDNKSIFNSKAIVPQSTRDFSFIPKNYYDWFIALFEKGERFLPPDSAGLITITIGQVKTINNRNLLIELIREYKADILYHRFVNGFEIVKTKDYIRIDFKEYNCSLDEELLFSPRESIPILCRLENNRLKCKALGNHVINTALELSCTDIMIIENTLYLKNGSNLIECVINDMGNTVILSMKNRWNIMPLSSTFFSSVIYQSILGKSFLVIPLPSANMSKCIYSQVKELDNYKIIDAKYSRKVCCLIGFDSKKYDRIILRYNEQHDKYDCRISEDIDYKELNFIVKDNGVVILIHDENTIEIFKNIMNDKSINTINNITLPLPLKLSSDGNTTLFFKDSKLNRLSLK